MDVEDNFDLDHLEKPSCSSETIHHNVEEDNDLQEVFCIEGIDVWEQNQEVIEEQVLQQIQTLAREHGKKKPSDDTTLIEKSEHLEKDKKPNTLKNNGTSLDIHEFIKRQEELRKKQQIVRQSQVSEHSKNVANYIAKRQTNANLQRKKRKHDNKKPIISEEKGKNINSVVNDGLIKVKTNSDSDYLPSGDDVSDDEYVPEQKKYNCRRTNCLENESNVERVKDDGNINCYKERLNAYYKELELRNELKSQNKEFEEDSDEEIEENYILSGDFKVPKHIWRKLYSYQQDGVEWLWKIHEKQMGGLLGDEMGLGKTVQVIAFLAALSHSKLFSKHGRYKGLGATLLICPVTVIHQWVKHFHDWWPEFRVAVLHQSGSYQGDKFQLISEINKENCILITTYSSVLKYKSALSDAMWHYLILDEGHAVRNPTTKVTVAVKRFTAEHRLLLTGSPMQNNLQELWSLFDFISPGILGTQQVFCEHFSNPIMQGGYRNATSIQEATALSVATTLKNIISPHMLRRAKAAVHQIINLPHKSEQVLFCSLTEEQTDLYKGYLMSDQVDNILGKSKKSWGTDNKTRANMLVAITTLRKICNHPDLYLGDSEEQSDVPEEELPVQDRQGYYKRSGKMIVVAALLKIWKRQGHKVLLFTQSRGMINIFEAFLMQENYKYLKMDGSTNVGNRQRLIDTFNQENSLDVFLLTTRVGGLGVNLTGANRVIIFDPDWNPAIDTQARERAWRIGQKKQVTIYRLLSAGTIEEKMYQRQVWKQLLSNKVLIDPRTQRIFKTSDLHDLFSLQETVAGVKPETENIFRNSKVEMPQLELTKQKIKKESPDVDSSEIHFDKIKIAAMQNMAQQIAKNFSLPKPSQKILNPKKKETRKLLESLTPAELMEWNRTKKLFDVEDPNANKVDDSAVNMSFAAALSLSEKKAKLYKDIKLHSKTDEKKKTTTDASKHTESSNKSSKKQKKTDKTTIDQTGVIDGEVVEGLVKREIRKNKNDQKKKTQQDDYVLQKLFDKSGVSTALQHDVIVQSGYQDKSSFKIRNEAQNKADIALNAIRKSRLKNWNW